MAATDVNPISAIGAVIFPICRWRGYGRTLMDPMAERMAALLRYANYQKVGDALGVGRAAVQKWAKGRNVGAYQLQQVERLFGEPFGGHDEAAPPEWARRLDVKVDAVLANQGRLALLIQQPPSTMKPDERLAVQYLRELLASIPLPPAEGFPEGDGSPDQGARGRAKQ